jgi:hypothetical protein
MVGQTSAIHRSLSIAVREKVRADGHATSTVRSLAFLKIVPVSQATALPTANLLCR